MNVNFTSRTVYLMNPLPKVTWAEVYDRAKVTIRGRRKIADQPAFVISLVFGSGENRLDKTLMPGEVIEIDERLAKEMVSANQIHNGGTGALAMARTKEELKESAIQALTLAEGHFQQMGIDLLHEKMAQLGHQSSEVEGRLRSNDWYRNLWVNVAREELIREQREQIEAPPSKVA